VHNQFWTRLWREVGESAIVSQPRPNGVIDARDLNGTYPL
jgi:hypothetical protein